MDKYREITKSLQKVVAKNKYIVNKKSYHVATVKKEMLPEKMSAVEHAVSVRRVFFRPFL